MMNTLEVGKAIYNLLNSNGINKVYPLVADEGVSFPFIVYRRSNFNEGISKDGIFEESINIQLVVASNTYLEALELAIKVRDIIESYKGDIEGINIDNITLVDAYEDYIENAFILNLIFNITII